MNTKAVSGIILILLFTSVLTLTFNIQSVLACKYPAIYIDPPSIADPTLTPGKNFTVSIKTDYTESDVWAYSFTLSYNPYVLHGIKAINGDLITKEKHSSALFAAGTFDNTLGILSGTSAFFFDFSPPLPVTSGPGTLANITFTVVGYGISNITLGDGTQLRGWDSDAWDLYDIINKKEQPEHTSHGYFKCVKPIHDIAAISILTPTTTIVTGQLVSNINVTIANEGNFTETFNVLAYTNTCLIGTQMGITLASGRRTTLTFNWDTTDLTASNCTVTAEAIAAGDADLTNNHASTTVIVAQGALNPTSPGYYETSEFLIGSVAVGVILPESNGTIDRSTEDWTSIEESQVVSEIRDGLDWWAAYNPSADVSFSMEVHYQVPTSYEPINRPLRDHWLWISETMTYLGYPGTYYDYHMQVRNYINDLRNRLGTNWAFAIFVADSSNDYDGKFKEFPYHGYAYFGGPHFVMTYDVGFYGIDKMDELTAHEMGHIFYATDEYNGFREYGGYLNVSDIEYSDCLMDNNVLRLSEGTEGQIGWRDTDGDGILDIVDTVPDTTLHGHTRAGYHNTLMYTGSVTVAAYPNRNPLSWRERRNITINTITNVEYRIDSGPWMNVTATDGAFDGAQENFKFTTLPLSAGVHKIEVRGTNSVGNVETSYANEIVTIAMPTVEAVVNIHPYVLNLKSKGSWITVYIGLPEGYGVGDINVSTILLNDVVPPENSQIIGTKLIVKFDRSKARVLLPHLGEVELAVTGNLFDGTPFEGSDTIRVR